jgi:hypothetical protein
MTIVLITCEFCCSLLFALLDILGIDYTDDENMLSHVLEGWWLEGETCKWMLAVLVHKDNPDVCSDPTAVAPKP